MTTESNITNEVVIPGWMLQGRANETVQTESLGFVISNSSDYANFSRRTVNFDDPEFTAEQLELVRRRLQDITQERHQAMTEAIDNTVSTATVPWIHKEVDYSLYDSEDIWALEGNPTQRTRGFHYRLQQLFPVSVYKLIVEHLCKRKDIDWCIAGSFAAFLLGPRKTPFPGDIDIYILGDTKEKQDAFMADMMATGLVQGPLVEYGKVTLAQTQDGCMKLNFIRPLNGETTTHEVIDRFDFNICQFAFNSEGAFWRKGAIEALEQRLVTINPSCTMTLLNNLNVIGEGLPDTDVCRTIRRYIKYSARGFTFPAKVDKFMLSLFTTYPKSYMKEDALNPMENLKDYCTLSSNLATPTTPQPGDPNYVPF